MSDFLSAMEFEDAPVVDGKVKLASTDLSRYEPVIEHLLTLPVGKVGKVTVPTGEIIQKGTNKGRGKAESADARGFHAAASKLGTGLRLIPKHNLDGTTTFRMHTKEKRVFSDEVTQKRNLANAKRYRDGAVAKANAALAAAQASPENADLELVAKTAAAKAQEYQAKVEALEAPAKAGGATKKAAQ